MKRTCNNCKALTEYGCDLGKKTSWTFHPYGWKQFKPLEECDKPLNNNDYVYLTKLKANKHETLQRRLPPL